MDTGVCTIGRLKTFTLTALIGLFCLGALQAAMAQIDQGAIVGAITDSTGRAIQGASVTLVSQETGLSFERKTNHDGSYRFSPIKIGLYRLTVTAQGFATQKQENINVDVGQIVGLNLSLKPGAVTQSITVTSSSEIQTQDASTGQVFTKSQLNDLPLLDRNYLFLAQLATGVNAPNQQNTQTSGSGSFASNGSRVSQNNFILDGVDNNSNMQDFLNGATYAVRPPPDALAEFKVVSSDYSAELGRGTGAAVNASIKEGTNTFHGSLWEYLRNDRLEANNYNFNAPTPEPKTSYHENIFGATLGGPILKDKLFFFADAQGTRNSSSLPTPRGRASTSTSRSRPTLLYRRPRSVLEISRRCSTRRLPMATARSPCTNPVAM